MNVFSVPWLTLVTVSTCCLAKYPTGPNRLLGTCLDAAWVKQMETSLGISTQDRDASGRLLYPFLQPALRFPRYRVEDPRTVSVLDVVDACLPAGIDFYGANQDAAGTTRGEINGTLVLDTGGWVSQDVATVALAIIAQEVVGYKVSLVVGAPTVAVTQRMSSARTGACTPTHLNLEVWTASTLSSLQVYYNESYRVGVVGYTGQTGIYTTMSTVQNGINATPASFPDFWRHYKLSDTLIDKLNVANFKSNKAYYPPPTTYCKDGYMGCKDHCEKSDTCTAREAAGKSCLVVAMMYPNYDRAYFQAVMSNLGIPAYFCFIGYDGVNTYADDAVKSGAPVLFIHWIPDPFHVVHKGQIERIFFPRSDPERVKLSTADYGENGYGQKTNNPVDVDYPPFMPLKYSASIVKDLPIGSVFSKLTLSDTDINALMGEYVSVSSNTSETEPYFRAACDWVKANYKVWSEWLDRLPICTFEEHIVSQVFGCESDSTLREIRFEWKEPNPGNTSAPNNCDGGVAVLPATIITSRSCDWIFENRRVWAGWIDVKPTCDSTFYDYNVSNCNSDTYRIVRYNWKYADALNALLSAECEGGVSLPSDLKINCEYMPTSSSTFTGIVVLSAITMLLLVVAFIVVYNHRNAPIIRRSQFEMLLLMIVGGFLTTGAAIAYAGRPTKALCGARPVLLTLGFTTIFGSLVIKSWRVYRIFLMPSMKRMKITIRRILKILSIFYVGDIVIFIVWFAVDFPEPTITTEEATEFRGTVDRITCKSSSFIFSALLIFWKAILLMMGLYLSFLIRNVSTDFQEAPWIFGSVCVVLVGSLVMMPMSYLVDMSAAAYYVFLACALLLSTLFIMGLMLVPKAFRLKESPTTDTFTPIRKRRSVSQLQTTEGKEEEEMTPEKRRRSSHARRRSSQTVKPVHHSETDINSTVVADDDHNTAAR